MNDTLETPRRSARRRIADTAAHAFGAPFARSFDGWRRVALLAALVVGGTLLSLARTPRHVWGTLWAEDGPIFVAQALESGPEVIFQGYAGYMHLIARAGAEIAVLFPLQRVPTVVTVIGALFASSIACACFVMMETRLRSLPLRLAAWLVCIALPIMGGEVVNNLANLHWYLLIAAFVAAATRSRSSADAVVQTTVLVVAVASDALALMLLPLVVYRWWALPARRDRATGIGFAVGAVLQVTVMLTQVLTSGGRPIAPERPSFSEFLDFYTYRVVLGGLFGTSGTAVMMGLVGIVLPGLALGAVLIALVLVWRSEPARRIGAVAFAAGSIGFSAVVFSMQWDGLSGAPLTEMFTGGRYIVVPTALLLLGLIVCVDVGVSRLRARSARLIVAGIALLAVIVPCAVDFRPMNIREGAASWSAELDRARLECGASADASKYVSLAIAPSWFGGIQLPCAQVQRG